MVGAVAVAAIPPKFAPPLPPDPPLPPKALVTAVPELPLPGEETPLAPAPDVRRDVPAAVKPPPPVTPEALAPLSRIVPVPASSQQYTGHPAVLSVTPELTVNFLALIGTVRV